MAECGRVAEQHVRASGSNRGDEFVQFAFRHLKCWQELCAQHLVPPMFDTVLLAQFDRGAPDDDFPIANVHTPPTGRTPLCGYIVTDALLADVKN